MSIQNRLLLIYTTIFSVAFLLIALIVYALPRNRILAQVDSDLEVLASEVVRPGNIVLSPAGVLQVSIPGELNTLETASTFMVIINNKGEIVARSQNIASFNVEGLLDENAPGNETKFTEARHDDTLLRVLTVPLKKDGVILGYLQVARLLDSYEAFTRVLIIALLVGLGAATASLFVAVWLTPSLFRPLEDIASVARQITNADDLSRRVPDTGRTDEIGVLARALNQSLERLERLFQAQQRLLADVSHELRTPLTAIRGNLDLMRRMEEGDPQSLDIIQDEIERMTRLVSDLLLLARADAGGLPWEAKPVELDNIFFEVYRQVSLMPKEVEVAVTAVDQACVMGDPDRLKQLLLNLIDNAIKYTPVNGTVSLSLSKTGGWAEIEVSDTGVGIPPEDLPHIFDRFYRVDKARSRAQGGSGLGLSIAKWIAQAHGGDIHVRSKVGEGTTFTIRLPVIQDEAAPDQQDAKEELRRTRPSLRILGGTRQRAEG